MGQVKILDFGLAKLAKGGEVGTTTDSSLEESLTQVGVIPGTAVYMSPEQARSEDLDVAHRYLLVWCRVVRNGDGEEAVYGYECRYHIARGDESEADAADLGESGSSEGAGNHYR